MGVETRNEAKRNNPALGTQEPGSILLESEGSLGGGQMWQRAWNLGGWGWVSRVNQNLSAIASQLLLVLNMAEREGGTCPILQPNRLHTERQGK